MTSTDADWSVRVWALVIGHSLGIAALNIGHSLPLLLRKIFEKIKCSSFASCQRSRASSLRVGSAVAAIRRKNFVSFASFLQVPILLMNSFLDTASSASQ